MSGRLILVRHGQSHGNVDKRLDTRPPGAELTPLGREQARAFARGSEQPPGLLAHSIATRARQTAAEISTTLNVSAHEFEGLHEVQVGDLENRNDDEAVDEFNRIYQRWHEGDLEVAMPGGETALDVLDRYVPVLTDLRMRHLDDHDWTGDIVVVSHGAAIRLVAKTLGRGRERLRARTPSGEHRSGGARADHRRPVELRALGLGGPAVLPSGPRTPQILPPIPWAERTRNPPRRSRSPARAESTRGRGNRSGCTPSAAANGE